MPRRADVAKALTFWTALYAVTIIAVVPAAAVGAVYRFGELLAAWDVLQ